MNLSRRFLLKLSALLCWRGPSTWLRAADAANPQPFGAEFPNLDSLAVGEWWSKTSRDKNPPPPLDVPRDEVVAFALYTQDRGVLKMTAQLYPLKPGEELAARLEVQRDGEWKEIAKTPVVLPGWSAHFRVEKWDATQGRAVSRAAWGDGDVRGTHPARPDRQGRDRRREYVVQLAAARRASGPRSSSNLKAQNPDLLFFAGDQTYRHTEHTAGWIEFGLQFREVMRDRPDHLRSPTITMWATAICGARMANARPSRATPMAAIAIPSIM